MKGRFVLAVSLMAVGLLAAAPLKMPLNEVGRVQYVDTVDAPGVSSAELMKRARTWLVGRSHLKAGDLGGAQPHCIVVGETFEVPHTGMPVSVFYTLAFEAQPGRFCATAGAMYVFDGSVRRPLEHYLRSDGTPRLNAWMIESVDKQTRGLLAELHSTVLRPAKGP